MKKLLISLLVSSVVIWPLQGMTEPGKGSGKGQQGGEHSEMRKQSEIRDQQRKQEQTYKEAQ